MNVQLDYGGLKAMHCIDLWVATDEDGFRLASACMRQPATDGGEPHAPQVCCELPNAVAQSVAAARL